MSEFPLRSPFAKVGGIFHFGRMLDKIRLHARGELLPDYQANLGKGFDGSCVKLLGIDYAEKKKAASKIVPTLRRCSNLSMPTKAEKSRSRSCSGGLRPSKKNDPPLLVEESFPIYGAAGCAGSDGGGGGCMRQSMNFHTARTTNTTIIAAMTLRTRDSPTPLLRERVDSLCQREIQIG
jgi:hypothetical protein